MSTMSRITLIGMYNYQPKLFDALLLPNGYDKETFVNSLLLEHGEKCVLYADPDFMYAAIGVWSKKWENELTKIYEALTAKYNPLHNYDRFEETSDEETGSFESKNNTTHSATDKPNYTDTQTNANTDTRGEQANDTRTHNNSATTTNDYNVTTSAVTPTTTEHTVSADNSSAYQADWKEITSNGKTLEENTGTITDSHSGTISDAHNGTVTDTHTGTIKHDINGTTQDLNEVSNGSENGTNEHKFKHSGRLYGNIGVTTSTQMLTDEVDARMKYNLYSTAGRLFANELLIGIY